MEKKLESAIPAIWETASDKVLSIKELKEKYTKYAHTHFIKAPSLVIINKAAKGDSNYYKGNKRMVEKIPYQTPDYINSSIG